MKILLHAATLTALAVSAMPLRADNEEEVAIYNSILASVQPEQTTVEMGDMTVPVQLVQAWRNRAMGLRGASQTNVDLWIGGVVYYAFESSVTEARRTHFRDACAEWAMFGNLTFTPRTSQANYIMVREDPAITGGNSALGMIGGRQYLTMGTASWNRVTLMHELGHALGLAHEHQRSDRDAYVQIITANITPGLEPNFVRVFTTTNNTPYDFDSIMHYWNSALSISPELDTIACRPGYEQNQGTMGRFLLDRWLSRKDQQTIAQLYGPGAALSAVVTNTKDSGPGSLRAAIYDTLNLAADAPASSPEITFQIPLSDPGYSGGVFTIRPTGRLPGPGPRVTIDGTTQTAFSGDTNPAGPEIVLNGALMTEAIEPGRAIILGESHSMLRGLVIQGFTSTGVTINGSNHRVEGCYIGTDASGTAAVANSFHGLAITNGATNNTVGPDNVISGNFNHGVLINGTGTGGNVVTGNRIGTDAAGTAAVANGWSGVALNGAAAGNTVGPGNVISGNVNRGVVLNGAGTADNVVSANYLGTNAAGTAAVANGWSGLAFTGGAAGNTVGPGNVISGNTFEGVLVTGTGTSENKVTGNVIGLNAAQTAAVPNVLAGVQVELGAQGTVIGGASAAERNIVAGNLRQGIAITGTGTSGNTVKGNCVGTGPTGTVAFANGWSGVSVIGGATNNTVGPGNVISGNANQGVVVNNAGTGGNIVSKNFIGTTASGNAALPNAWSGVNVLGGASGNTVGPGNVISGNLNQGVLLSAAGTNGNKVHGNFIGTNATGTAALPNAWSGVQVNTGAQANIVGGLLPAERNVISGNTLQGLILNGTGTSGNFVRGNFIGTNAGGTAALANISTGVDVYGGATANVIGGTVSGEGNVISGNATRGVSFSGAGTNANICTGNIVGLNAAGAAGLANAGAGIIVFGGAMDTVIGAAGGGRNFIAGNSNSGLRISGTGTNGTLIVGNSIGVTPAGAVIPNSGDGVEFYGGAADSLVGGSAPGSANLIRGNARDGVGVYDAATVVAIAGNSIYGNSGEGIDLAGNGITANDSGDGDTGPNGLQNFPLLTSAVLSDSTVVAGSLNTAAGVLVRIDFYASTAGDEGQFHLGSITGTTNAGGNLAISAVLPARVPAGYNITATATGPGNNTSEFSAPRAVTTTDSDSDGMPDAWESANGLNAAASDAALDLDSDGQTNLAEFRSGTDPRNSVSFLRLHTPAISSSGAAISFTSIIGVTYRLDYSPSLAPGSWQMLADQLHAGGGLLMVTDPAAVNFPRRFYRLSVVP